MRERKGAVLRHSFNEVQSKLTQQQNSICFYRLHRKSNCNQVYSSAELVVEMEMETVMKVMKAMMVVVKKMEMMKMRM